MTQWYEGRPPVKTAPNAPLLAVGIPTRGLFPAEFAMALMQAQAPLGVMTTYLIEKGRLPAEARNHILKRALADGQGYALFLDDDVLFPPMAWYRLWAHIRQHPEAAAVTGVVSMKSDPAEPMLYRAEGEGAYWDWALGDLVPVRGAGAGCLMVNLDYVRRLEPPWFQDAVTSGPKVHELRGHDRFFLDRLQDEAGGVVYADTGTLCGHFDHAEAKVYCLPATAPCFQRPIAGECYIPVVSADGMMQFARLVRRDGSAPFLGYLAWLATQEPAVRTLLPGEKVPADLLAGVAA